MKQRKKISTAILCLVILLLCFSACAESPAEEPGRVYTDADAPDIEEKCIDILASNKITYKNRKSNGVTWKWDTDKQLSVKGTAGSMSFTDLYSDKGNLPRGVQPGDTLYSRLEIEGGDVGMEFLFYCSDGTSREIFLKDSGTVEVPKNAVGLSMWPVVYEGQAADAIIRRFELYRPAKKETQLPLVVSFIDDDATKDVYVEKYHDACVKNGICGNYAVITGNLERGRTSAEKMVSYQKEGFGMLPHCHHQDAGKYPYWQGAGDIRTPEELEECRQDLATCISSFELYGLENPFLWVTPFGIQDRDIVDLAKDSGMKALFTIGTDGINTVYYDNRWSIRRVALDMEDTEGNNSLENVKTQIDQFADEGQGWLIIATHFNTWGDIPWDETPDENGNEIGYERFNEVVRYALDADLEPMTIPEAFEVFGNVMDENLEEYENAVVLR